MKYLLIIFTVISCCCMKLQAQQSSSSYYDSVYVVTEMQKYDINGDGIKDVIVGRYYSSEIILPFFIKWGIDTTAVIDTTLPKYTSFIYPNYRFVNVSIEFAKLCNDTTNDMLLMFDGRVKDTNIVNNDTLLSERDTFDIVVLLTTPNLRNISKINLGNVNQNQFLNNVVFRLTDSLRLSQTNSYIIPQYNLGYNMQKQTINDMELKYGALPEIMDVLIYPNPCSKLLNIELHKIPIGSYSIQIFDKIGNKIYEEHINMNHNEDVMAKEINLDENLGSGNYYFVLTEDNKVIYKKNIVIHK